MAKSKLMPEKRNSNFSRLDGAVILLVDDDPVFVQMASTFLISQGSVIQVAANGIEGLRQLKKQSIDLVVCDLSMPLLDGVEFVQEVSLTYPGVPVVVVSATDKMSEVARALKYGIKDFLCKPIRDYRQLAAAIEDTLEDVSSSHESMVGTTGAWLSDDGDEDNIDPEIKELQLHLEALQADPDTARDLLLALMPEPEVTQNGWTCSYRLLQSADKMPLVFDYGWVAKGHLVFYAVDTHSPGGCGVATTLLIRALFHDYLRNIKKLSPDLHDMVNIVEQGIGSLQCASPVSALFGVADLALGYLSLMPVGMEFSLVMAGEKKQISGGQKLGSNGVENLIIKDRPMYGAAQISVNSIGANSFVFDLAEEK